MDSIAKRKLAVLALAVLMLSQPARPGVDGQDLHAQSAAALLQRDFSDPNLSYFLLDGEGQIIAQRWDGPAGDIPVGSLLKPFFAVAYGRTHRSFPVYRCAGKKTCWLARGHGKLYLREAIAFSCNSYFHQLVAAAGLSFRPAMESFNLRTQMKGPASRAQMEASPVTLARAYLELTRHAGEAAVDPVLQGLALSASKGTAKAVAVALPTMAALAKTGTAPCVHTKKAPGDGFALVMAPADHPRSVLLIRLHGRPGFMAAAEAGRMISKIESSGDVSQ